MNIFEINELNFVEKHIGDVRILEMDNFYKYPEKILEFLNANPPSFHKLDDDGNPEGFNGVYFEDKRHKIKHADYYEPQAQLSEYLDCELNNEFLMMITNQFTMKNSPFNKPTTHYWCPHKDSCKYAGLVYLNTFDCDGTNFYLENNGYCYNEDHTIEHKEPWKPKKNYKLLGTTKAKFNRLCLFQGDDVLHGMALDETFVEPFEEKRLNQVIFI